MTETRDELDLVTVGGDQLGGLRAELLDVYRDAYADRIGNPFYAPDRYWERISGYATRDGFALVAGRVDDALVGYALGFRLAADTAWWEDLQTPVEPADVVEDGARTFAVNELMVRPVYRGRGYGRALHDALLTGRPERRATLLVRPDNHPARPAYVRWGWRKLGETQPFPDSPRYDVMVYNLAAREA